MAIHVFVSGVGGQQNLSSIERRWQTQVIHVDPKVIIPFPQSWDSCGTRCASRRSKHFGVACSLGLNPNAGGAERGDLGMARPGRC